MGFIKGDTRSFDNGSYGPFNFEVLGFWVQGLGLRV